MGFSERAVEACRRDWLSGVVDENHVRDVLKSKKADVSGLEEFLGESYSHEIRWAAARILSEMGRISEVVSAALLSKDRESIFGMLSILGKSNVGLDALECLLSSEDTMVRDAAIDMFRKAGQEEILFSLVFDKDDSVVKRIKRYIDEAGQRRQTCSSREPA